MIQQQTFRWLYLLEYQEKYLEMYLIKHTPKVFKYSV